MPDREWWLQLVEQARALPYQQKVAIAATAVGSLAFFLYLAISAGGTEYKMLYRGLTDNEAGQITQALQADNIPYRLDEEGTSILVPSDALYDTRLQVAAKGLPLGGSPGFEIFDRQGFGVTDFVHRVNYRRGLQGELERSIEKIDAVVRSRVQIAIPDRSGFLRDAKKQASASVVVELRPGQDLDPEQAKSVVHLVASSVEGLDPSRITVVDDRGRMLAPQGEEGTGPRATSGALAYQQRVEDDLSQRITSLLEKTVGFGRVVAEVRADLDWTESESTEERYDPESQVARSEQVQTESSSERLGEVGGVPGAAANTPDLVDLAPDTVTASSKQTETINYEISKTVTHSVAPSGSIQRLSVAVLLDGKTAPVGAGPDAGEGAQEGEAEAAPGAFIPWNDEEILGFEKLVKQAVGFDADRGDELTITSAPFQMIALEEPGWFDPELLGVVSTVVRQLALLAAVMLFGLYVVRPMLAALGLTSGGSVAPATAEELEAELITPDDLEREIAARARDMSEEGIEGEVSLVASEHSDDTVKILRNWIGQN